MPTTRELLIELMASVQADQSSAIIELNEYLNSAEALNFQATILNFRSRTVPGGHQDQVLGGLLRVLDAVAGVTQAEVSQSVKVAGTTDLPQDPPVSPPADAPVAPDPAIPPDEPLELEPDAPLAADETGGEVQ